MKVFFVRNVEGLDKHLRAGKGKEQELGWEEKHNIYTLSYAWKMFVLLIPGICHNCIVCSEKHSTLLRT